MGFELDPREADRFVRPMDPRRELVYRLAIRAVCERCGSDREFRERTDALTACFGKELPDLLNEANRLGAELMASASGR
jgi:hypothetical protein